MSLYISASLVTAYHTLSVTLSITIERLSAQAVRMNIIERMYPVLFMSVCLGLVSIAKQFM